MDDHEWLAERMKADHRHLTAVAYRMLGSLTDAEDAVQEAWIRLSRTDTSGVANLTGWLTTVVARVCLDMLRSRKSRREELLGAHVPEPAIARETAVDPESEMVLADSVGLALLVVLETLQPAERIAFVLHDMFDLPFEEIAPIVDRSPVAARQLASRARRRVHGAPTRREPDVARQREVVEAFVVAARGGDFDALLAILDPDVVLRLDRAVTRSSAPSEVRGAATVAKGAIAAGARAARPALIDGSVGLVVAPRGRLLLVLVFTITDGKIVAIDAVGEPDRLEQLELAVLD